MDFTQRGYQSLDTAFAKISLEQIRSCCVQNNKHCDVKISTFRASQANIVSNASIDATT